MSPTPEIAALAETALVAGELTLEPLRPGHAEGLFDGLADPALYRFIPQEPPADAAALRARFERLAARRSPAGDQAWLNWAIRLPDGSHAGLVEATVGSTGAADIAYFVFRRCQGRGIGRRAVGAVVDALAAEPATTAIGASIDTRNAASIALVEALGFERTGLIRDADHFKGAASDEVRYQLPLGHRETGRRS
ncbi:GNAT family N-acetyltransferase [Mycobacterium sp. KBS0706]|uniref:GNAT family N-acetyltransferase n=1 Tax=Mycobacterium sp. KBS0706 TaxID=2578109 RepID=UPI00110FC547|nr:GNAT family N-acetyltransferase [Mycobacterium sp. KBS0706]TSD84221.1 GNAT family N-acetyltransferase [Mycobacterium sp. KBS0706]